MMKKRIMTIFSIVLLAGCFSACGLDLAETINYANEQLQNEQLLNQPTGEIEAGNDGFNLESAITGALEDEGVSTITDEGALNFDVPEGYMYDEANNLYISMDSTANIRVEKYAKDGKVMYASKEAMELVMENSLSEKHGYEVDVTVSDTEEITIGDYEGACITYEYILDGKEIVNKQILVAGDKNDHALAFLYYRDSPYADDWDEIKESVRFE